MDEEAYLRSQLARLHREFSIAAKPILDRLVEIEMAKPIVVVLPLTLDAQRLTLQESHHGP